MYTAWHRFFVALRESFLSVLPYVLIISIFVLLEQVFGFFDFNIIRLSRYFIDLFPLVLFISIIYHFSIRFNIDFIISLLTSFSIVLVIYTLFFPLHTNQITDSSITIFMIFVPITTVLSLNYYNTVPLSILFASGDIKGIWHILITYFKMLLFWTIIYSSLYFMISYLWNQFSIDLSSQNLLLVRTFFVQLFWFFGIHGNNFYTMITDTNFVQDIFISGMNYREILHFFVVLGGSGMIISLITSILIFSKERYSRRISKMSIPFSLFNIGEMMIFGLPIVFNRHLVLPFIFIPIINILVVYYVLPLDLISVVHHDIPWSTPIFINIYYATGGDWRAVVMQACIYLLDVMIYAPFVIRYSNTQSIHNQYNILEKSLGIAHEFNEKKGIELYDLKQSIIDSNIKLASIIDTLSNNELLLYLQPVIDIEKNKIAYYEALLRIKLKDGKIEGPYFLEDIEASGLANIIDIWVCTEVSKHLESTIGPEIQININIHPDTLSDVKAIQKIITILDKKNIAFEIIERALLHNEKALANINILKQHGFKICIDDMGDGYSSYMMLCTLPIDIIKIDKSLIDIMHTDKGYKVITHLFSLSKSLGYECIVEGIQTESQLRNIKKIGIKYVQGFYFSPALSISEALAFTVKK